MQTVGRESLTGAYLIITGKNCKDNNLEILIMPLSHRSVIPDVGLKL